MTAESAFRALVAKGRFEDDYLTPFYVEDLKRRVTVVRVDGFLHAFDDGRR